MGLGSFFTDQTHKKHCASCLSPERLDQDNQQPLALQAGYGIIWHEFAASSAWLCKWFVALHTRGKQVTAMSCTHTELALLWAGPARAG